MWGVIWGAPTILKVAVPRFSGPCVTLISVCVIARPNPAGDAPAAVSEPGNVPASCRAYEDGAACDGPACRPRMRWTALPKRARSVVGEHPGGLNDTGTDAGSVLNAELAGSAPPHADRIVR